MATFRCTAAVLKKLNVQPEEDTAEPGYVFGDWFVNLFRVQGKEFFIFTSSTTLVSIITRAGKELPLARMSEVLLEMLEQYNVHSDVMMNELATLEPIEYAKTNSRRVLGSMNDFVKSISYAAEAKEFPEYAMSKGIHYHAWETPMTYLKYNFPIDALRNILQGKDATDRTQVQRRGYIGCILEPDDISFFGDAVPESKDRPRVELPVSHHTVIRPDGSTTDYPHHS